MASEWQRCDPNPSNLAPELRLDALQQYPIITYHTALIMFFHLEDRDLIHFVHYIMPGTE